MRVACPACGTEYEAPDHLAGRALRCAACGHVFQAPGDAPPTPRTEPPAPPAVPAPFPVPAEAPADGPPADAGFDDPAAPDRAQSLAAAPPSATLSATPRIAWGASLVALALGLIALHAFRVEIAAAWPPMLRLYAALGLL